MGSDGEAFVPIPSSYQDARRKEKVEIFFGFCLFVCIIVCIIVGMVFLFRHINKEEREAREALEKSVKEAQLYVPDITIQSMDFAALNVTEISLSVNWDVLIRIPSDLPGVYMCIYGDFQVSVLYKGATIATYSRSYNLVPRWAQQLNVSMIVSEGDMDGATVKDIVDVVKNKGEIKFGSQLVVPDCRLGSTGKMKFDCDEATLRFASQRNATLLGNLPICHPVLVGNIPVCQSDFYYELIGYRGYC